MKKILLFFIGFFFCAFSFAHTIGIGYGGRDVRTWRYYEIEGGNNPKPKILIMNDRDSAITFFMIKCRAESEMTRKDRDNLSQFAINNDTVLGPIVIQPHEYFIGNLVSTGKYTYYDRAFINGQSVGIKSDMRPLKLEHYNYPFYSYEGIYGSNHSLI